MTTWFGQVDNSAPLTLPFLQAGSGAPWAPPRRTPKTVCFAGELPHRLAPSWVGLDQTPQGLNNHGLNVLWSISLTLSFQVPIHTIRPLSLAIQGVHIMAWAKYFFEVRGLSGYSYMVHGLSLMVHVPPRKPAWKAIKGSNIEDGFLRQGRLSTSM